MAFAFPACPGELMFQLVKNIGLVILGINQWANGLCPPGKASSFGVLWAGPIYLEPLFR